MRAFYCLLSFLPSLFSELFQFKSCSFRRSFWFSSSCIHTTWRTQCHCCGQRNYPPKTLLVPQSHSVLLPHFYLENQRGCALLCSRLVAFELKTHEFRPCGQVNACCTVMLDTFLMLDTVQTGVTIFFFGCYLYFILTLDSFLRITTHQLIRAP